jgi:hypothetical protein
VLYALFFRPNEPARPVRGKVGSHAAG